MHTPMQVRWALAFAVSRDAWFTQIDTEEFDSAAGFEVKAWLISEGLISDNSGDWGAPTDKLRAYIDHLCAQPLPSCKWGY